MLISAAVQRKPMGREGSSALRPVVMSICHKAGSRTLEREQGNPQYQKKYIYVMVGIRKKREKEKEKVAVLSIRTQKGGQT